MGDLFSGCGAHVQYLYIEYQVAAGQRVVGIQIRAEFTQLHYPGGLPPFAGIYLYQHPLPQAALE